MWNLINISNMQIKIKNEGFIALISVIVIGTVLLIASITLSLNGFYGRFNILNTEFKEISNKLVDACLERARLSIGLSEYTNDEVITLTIENYSCKYVISENGQKIEIYSRAQDACTYYEAEVNEEMWGIPIVFMRERDENEDLSMCD